MDNDRITIDIETLTETRVLEMRERVTAIFSRIQENQKKIGELLWQFVSSPLSSKGPKLMSAIANSNEMVVEFREMEQIAKKLLHPLGTVNGCAVIIPKSENREETPPSSSSPVESTITSSSAVVSNVTPAICSLHNGFERTAFVVTTLPEQYDLKMQQHITKIFSTVELHKQNIGKLVKQFAISPSTQERSALEAAVGKHDEIVDGFKEMEKIAKKLLDPSNFSNFRMRINYRNRAVTGNENRNPNAISSGSSSSVPPLQIPQNNGFEAVKPMQLVPADEQTSISNSAPVMPTTTSSSSSSVPIQSAEENFNKQNNKRKRPSDKANSPIR